MSSSDSQRNPLERLAEEFAERQRRGEHPSLTEYTDKYPQWADEIRELFPALVLMEQFKPRPGDATGAEVSLAPAEGQPLERLGDYRILREIGRGGMGIVYEAEQVSLGRHVALKVLPSQQLLDPRQLGRFQREAKAAARLHHTNIVPVYGVGEANGLHYYVMQFIQGQGLDQVLDELRHLRQARPGTPAGPEPDERPREHTQAQEAAAVAQALLSGHFACPAGAAGAEDVALAPAVSTVRPAEAALTSSALVHLPGQLASGTLSDSGRPYWQSVARVGIQVAEALAYAHHQGTLHRDIKPSNLLVDTQGLVWITDFGLAKAMDDHDNLTHTGDLVGTLRYMAPERFEGQADARSDLYALGLTLYELLTLRPAFDEADRHKLASQVMHMEPPRPRKLNPLVPRDLETIVLKAIAREPAQRYQTALELAEDLKRFVEDRPIQARRASVRERAWRWCRRNPLVASLTAALTLLLIAVAVGASATAFHFGQMAETERDLRIEAQQAKETAEDSDQKSRHALVEMYTSYGLVAVDRNDPGQGVLWFAHAARLAGAGTEQEQANRIRVTTWGRQALQPVRALPHAAEWLQRLAFHPDGRYLLTQTVRFRSVAPEPTVYPTSYPSDEECTLWDLVEETPISWPAGIRTASSAAWSPEGRQMALGTPQGEVVLCTFPAGAMVRRIPSGGRIRVLLFSPDGHYLAIASANMARVWDCQAQAFVTPELEHPEPVTTLAFHPRGHRLATGCLDHQARVFAIPISISRGEPLFSPVPHYQPYDSTRGGMPIAPTFLDEGRGLLTASFPIGERGSDRSLIWRNADSGAVVRSVPLPEGGGILAVAVSPDGRYFAVGGFGGAQIWEVARGGRAVSPFLRNRWEQAATSAAFSPDGRTLLVGSSDRILRHWSVPDGQALGGPLAHPTHVLLAAFSPDGRFLASAQRGGLVRVWAAPTDNPRDYPLPLDGVCSMGKFSREGRFVLPTGHTNRNCTLRSTRVYEVATGQPAGPSLAGGGIILDAAFSPDGRQVAALVTLAGSDRDRHDRPGPTSAQPGQVKLWDWRTGELTCPPLTVPSEPCSLDYSPDGQRLAVLCAGGSLLMVNPITGQLLTQWRATATRTRNGRRINGMLRFSPDGQSVLTFGGGDSAVRVWEATTGQERYALTHAGFCSDAQISADGRLLATASSDKSVRIWDIATGRPLADSLPHPDWLNSAVFSRDGTQVLTGCRDGMARLWDWRAGRLVCAAFEHEYEVTPVAFHPNGRWVLTVSDDGIFRVWDGGTSKPVTPPLPTGGGVGTSVAVTPDGNYAVVGDWVLGGGSASALQVFSLGDLSDTGTLDLDDLCTWGELLSGRRVHEGSGVTNLTADEWLTRWREFRQRHAGAGSMESAAALASSWREAGASERARHWPAAIRHLDRLIRAYPTVGPLHARRGDAHAELEQWDKAAADYARASELRPDDIEIGQRHALLCLALGGEEGYRRVCADLLQRFGGTVSVYNVGFLAWISALRPDAVPEPSRLVPLAEKAVQEYEATGTAGKHPYLLRSLGAALYRAGRFEEAIQQLNESVAVQGGIGGYEQWLFLAIAHHRLGHAAEARQWLDKTIQWAEQKQTDARALSWHQRLELQFLRREAEELIQKRNEQR